jgi:hypothetical protein
VTLPDYDAVRQDYEDAFRSYASRAVTVRGGLLVVAMFTYMFLHDLVRLLPTGLGVGLAFVPLGLFIAFCNPRKLRNEFERNHALDDFVRARENGEPPA